MDLSSLEILIAAIEEKSLSHGAERVHLVTSAVSKRISELERRLGTTLLRRHGRGVEATPAGYEADVWYAVFASGGTPPEVVARLNLAVKRATEAPIFRSRVESEGLVTAVGTPDELTRYLRSEEVRWRKVVAEGRITID